MNLLGLTDWAGKLLDEVGSIIGDDNAVPPDEPADIRALATAWGEVAKALEDAVAATNTTANEIFAGWPDRAGYSYLNAITSFNSDVGGLIAACREMQTFCEAYAQEVHIQRMATRIEMLINAASFALAFAGGGGAIVARMFAGSVARNVVTRMLAAAARTALSAGGRPAVRAIALGVKDVTLGTAEEAVISAGSQLWSQAAGYNPGGIDSTRLAKDTVAGFLGEAAALGPGKAIHAVAPKGFVGQHLAAAAAGGGLTALTSPGAGVLADDLVEAVKTGEFHGAPLSEYGKSYSDNMETAARMGAFRANGNVLSSQLGSMAGAQANVADPTQGLGELTNPATPDGPPPDNTPATGAGQATSGATGADPGAASAGGEATGGGTGTGVTGATGAGEGTAGAPVSGKGVAPGATGQHSTVEGSTGENQAGPQGSGAAENVAGQPTGSSTTTGPGTGGETAGGQTSGTQAPGGEASSTGGQASGGETSGSQASGTEASGTGGQGTGEAGQASNAGDPAAGGQAADPGGQAADPGGQAASGQAANAGSEVSGGPAAVGAPTATPPATSGKTGRGGQAGGPPSAGSTSDPAVSAEATQGPATPSAQAHLPKQTGNGPVEIPSKVWQRLSQPFRDAVDQLVGRREVWQSVHADVARLAGLNLSDQSKQDIIGRAGVLPAKVLTALVDIAQHAPGDAAFTTAMSLAQRNLHNNNRAIKEIGRLVTQKSPALDALLAKLGVTPPASAQGQPTTAPPPTAPPPTTAQSAAARSGGTPPKAATPRTRQTEPWARFPLPDNHGLPDDARMARRRDVARVRAAEVVRTHLRPGLQRAADEAAATFRARPADQRYTGQRATVVDEARAAAAQATADRRAAQERGAGKSELSGLRKLESRAWRNVNIVESRQAGSEIHAIFEAIIKRDHDTLLGEHAGEYRLRTEAPYNLDGRASHPGRVRPDLVLERLSPNGGAWYTAHVYDLKTGKTGIGGTWAFRVDRMARGLFEAEEIRPSGPGRRPAPGTPDPTPDGHTPAPASTSDPVAQSAATPPDNRPRQLQPEVWQTLSPRARDAISDVFAQTTKKAKKLQGAIIGVTKANLPPSVVQDILELACELQGDVMRALVGIAQRAPGSAAYEAAITVARNDPAGPNREVTTIRARLSGDPADLDAYLAEKGLLPSGSTTTLPAEVGDAVAVLAGRHGTDGVVAAIDKLARKMPTDVLARYLRNIAASTTRIESARSLAEQLAAMTVTQVDAFGAQVARVAARQSLPTRYLEPAAHQPPSTEDPGQAVVTPATAGAVGDGKGFVQEAGDIHTMLVELARRGVNVASARKVLDEVMGNVDLHVWAGGQETVRDTLKGNAQGVLGLLAEVTAALALSDMPPSLLAQLGLPGLTVTGLRIGKDPDSDIAARLPDGREVRIEVKDYHAFTAGRDTYQEIARQVAQHRGLIGDDGMVIVLLTNDELSPAQQERVRRQTVFPRPGNRHEVADALVADGADMVLRYDGFDMFSVLAERPAADPAKPVVQPDPGPAAENQGGHRVPDEPAVTEPVDLGPGLLAAPARLPLLPATRVVTEPMAALIRGIAQSSMRLADRLAGMRSVTPPAGDSGVYRITYAPGRTFEATVGVADLGGTVAASHLVDFRQAVHITVSSRARPTAVPMLVAAALGEVAATLSGRGAEPANFLVKGSSGDPMLSVRDHGRMAQLLAFEYLLRRNPFRPVVRAALTRLIDEMGLDPAEDGGQDRLTALPDERMRQVVREHTNNPDGLLRTVGHLVKAAASELPVAGAVLFVMQLGHVGEAAGLALISASVVRALTHALFDRWVAAREDAALDEHFAPRQRELTDEADANDALAILQALTELRSAAKPAAEPAVSPSGEARPVDPARHQFRRAYGVRRTTGALSATAALGVMAVVGAELSLEGLSFAIAGVFASSWAQAAAGPFADAWKRHLIVKWKTARKDALLTNVHELVAGRHRDIVAHAGAVVDGIGVRLADRFKWAPTDGVFAQGGRVVVPRSVASVSRDVDPNAVARFLHLWWEYAGFRGGMAAASAAFNVVVGSKQYEAEQDARNRQRAYDVTRDADLDVAALQAVVANILGTTVPELAEHTSLAADEDRPSGLPPKKWLLTGVAVGLLGVGVAFAFSRMFGIEKLVHFYAAGAVGPPTDGAANLWRTAQELKAADAKAELGRAAARSARTTFIDALTEFARDVQSDAAPEGRSVADGPVRRILAARDAAYRTLVGEVRDLADRPGTSLTEASATLVRRVVGLHNVAARAESLDRVRGEAARNGQVRAESVERAKLIAAIQKYNGVPGVTPLPVAELFDGVHAGNADVNRLNHEVPGLPALPADTNGQAAAVTVDRHFRDPGSPYTAPEDLTASAGNARWADRVAAAAGVPGGRFHSIATINDIVDRLAQLGQGSRAIVHAARTDDDGIAASGDLVNAVNVNGQVYFIDAVRGGPVDVTGLVGGLSMLITEDNGEHARTMAGKAGVAVVRAVADRVSAGTRDVVLGSLLTDRAAPGVPGPSAPPSLSDGLTRIASVINPDRYLPESVNPKLGNDLPSNRGTFSDLGDFEELPERPLTELLQGLGVARALAGMVAAMLESFGDTDVTGLPEYERLTELLRHEDLPPETLLDAMTELMGALVTDEPADPLEGQRRPGETCGCGSARRGGFCVHCGSR